jgi:hypothetical protein
MAESTKHRHAFARYFRLGAERSIEKLHAAMRAEGKAPSLRTLYDWSSRHDWQDRIAEFESEARETEQEVFVAEIREMNERHAQEALLLQQKGAEWLAATDAEAATPAAAIRAIDVGIRLERVARDADKKVDFEQEVREWAHEEGLDEEQAVLDAARHLRRIRQ